MALIGEMRFLQIGGNTYEIPTSELPIASSSTLGGIKVGTNLSIDSSTGVLSASFTETDPVFSASAAAGITATDITNWDNKVSDTGKWNDVSLNKTISDLSNQEAIIPFLWNSSDTVARFAKVSKVPSYNCIAQYNNGYLNSTTPDASDSSTKVATTAWVTGKGYLTSYTETDPTVPSWAKAESKPTYTANEVGAVATSAVGAASGVAPLNASSKIDSIYLPSYVDDIIEGYYYNSKFWKEAAHTTEITGEAGKIYVDLSTDKTYRYSGTGYVEVSSGSLVTVTRNLTSGTKSATISIDGTDYDIYSEKNTDTKVTQTPLNGMNSIKGLLFSNSMGSTQTTDTVYTSNKILYSDYSQTLYIYNSDRTKYGTHKFDTLSLANSATSYAGLLKTADVTANRTYTLPDATGTIALTSDIPSIPVNVSAFTNDAGYITSSDIPVTSVNGNTGAVTLDVDKWNGVSLANQVGLNTGDTTYVVTLGTATSLGSVASKYPVTRIPTAHYIPKYDDNAYLLSTTPSANDNSTKVATTAFVASVVSGISIPTASSTTPAMDGTAAVGSETTFARGDHVHPTDTSRAASTSVTTQATIDNAGLITYKNSENNSLYTVQLPLFDGGSGASELPFLPLAGGSLTGNLSVGGTTTSTGLLTANGGISTTTLTTSGNTTVGGNLSVSGTTTYTKLLTANGGISTTTLTTSGNTVVGGTLGVTGATTLGNTLGVTGAATLDSTLDVTGTTTVENVTINGVLDVTKRRCYAASLNAGWYRVLTFAATSATYARGATGNEIVFHITRRRTTTSEETHEIKALFQYDNVSFVGEISKSISNYQHITKIRYTYDGSNGYVDIYVAATSAHVTVDFEVYCEPAYQALYTATGLQSVADSPSGETVLTEYTFAANTAGTASLIAITSRGAIISGEAVHVGRMIHLNFVFEASDTATNSPQIASAPSALCDTALSAIDITNGMSTAINESIPCGIGTTGRIFLQKITSGHIYAITGDYMI